MISMRNNDRRRRARCILLLVIPLKPTDENEAKNDANRWHILIVPQKLGVRVKTVENY